MSVFQRSLCKIGQKNINISPDTAFRSNHIYFRAKISMQSHISVMKSIDFINADTGRKGERHAVIKMIQLTTACLYYISCTFVASLTFSLNAFLII